MIGSRTKPVHMSSRRSLLSSLICILVSQAGQGFPENRRHWRRHGHTKLLRTCESELTEPDIAACVCPGCAGIHAACGRDRASTLLVLQETIFRPNMPGECHPAIRPA